MGSPGTSPFRLPRETTQGISFAIDAAAPSNAPTSLSRRHPHVGVTIETEHQSNLFAPTDVFDWTAIHRGIDGADTVATLVGGLDQRQLKTPGSIGDQHLDHLLEVLNPDRRVRIAQVVEPNGLWVYFQGYPLKAGPSWSEKHQTVQCTCISEGHEVLRTSEAAQIMGKLMRRDPLGAWLEAAPDDRLVMAELPVFNAGNKPNRSANPYPFSVGGAVVSTLRAHLFVEDGAPDGQPWTFVQALTYVLSHHCERHGLSVSAAPFLGDTAGILESAPLAADNDPLWHRLTQMVPAISVASMNVEEALQALCKAAGLHYEIALDTINGAVPEFYVRVFASILDAGQQTPNAERMGTPIVRDIPREAPFTPMTGRSSEAIAKANRAVQADLTYDRNVITHGAYLGGPKEYEVTLLLRPGWKPLIPNPLFEAWLDDFNTDEERGAAVDFWEEQFENEFEETTSGTRIPTSQFHGSHPNHHLYADVGRLWIFPDDARYVTNVGGVLQSEYARKTGPWDVAMYSPYNPDFEDELVLTHAALGGGIVEAKEWVPRRRPFGDTIRRVLHATTRAPIVRLNFKATDPNTALADPNWVRYAGDVRIASDRAALYLSEHNLRFSSVFLTEPEAPKTSMNMLDAYIGLQDDLNEDGSRKFGASHFMVAVTCTIRGDDRLLRRPQPTSAALTRRRVKVIDLGMDRFRFRDAGRGNSHLNAQSNDEDPEYRGRDDDNLLFRVASEEAELAAGETIAGSIDIPWIDNSYRLGDAFAGCAGLGMQFGRFPELVQLEYTKDMSGGGYRTILHLSDLRNSPEADHA